jgi:hypothetical protein
MSNTELIEKPVSNQIAEELLLRSVIDSEFRSEFLMNSESSALPSPVSPQDIAFVEIVKDALDISMCRSTCVSGFTIRCDGTTFE